ncbi:MAG TPA: YciI family protein [Gemmatimonadaceae bacterium]|jgi:hypothetical protein|nr:YciI family protein [Gemmatimonadaceae bacterium]
MALWRPTKEPVGAPKPEEMAAMGKLIEEMMKEGVLIATDGLQSSASGAIVRQTNGKITVTDGPFAETKELVAGYAIFNVKSKEHMIELTKRFLKVVGHDGVSEIRQMYEG